MRTILSLLLFAILAQSVYCQAGQWSGPSVDLDHGRLIVSDNNRFLIFEDGTPFFYLGDTGWELFHRLTREETEKYLENRRSKGFTVIQAVILAEHDGLNTPNMNGDKPLTGNDPLQPDENYFRHIDWVIQKAAEKGLFIGLLPTWGDKVDKYRWGIGPEIFNPENAYAYGKWLGERYKDFPNIIWINGGDRSGGGENFPVWEALGKGIKSADPNHLMTYHPWGEHSSSEWFHNSDWLDFNMMQTGHGQRSYSIYQKLMVPDYARNPVKPCIDGEPRYEDHPVGWQPEIRGWFNEYDIRKAIYWGVLTGGHGTTYGCHPIWQFLTPGREPISWARHYWYDVLDLPGASQLIYLRRLIESRDYLSREPFQDLVLNKHMTEDDYIVASRGKDYALIYIPAGSPAQIDLNLLGTDQVKAWWYDPRSGAATEIGTIPGKGIKEFNPPAGGRGNDWVLVLDSANAGYEKPGKP